MKRISCVESDAQREGLEPLSSLTNWVGGEVVNPELPAVTRTTWGLDDREVLRDEFNADGCRHWLMDAPYHPATDDE